MGESTNPAEQSPSQEEQPAGVTSTPTEVTNPGDPGTQSGGQGGDNPDNTYEGNTYEGDKLAKNTYEGDTKK